MSIVYCTYDLIRDGYLVESNITCREIITNRLKAQKEIYEDENISIRITASTDVLFNIDFSIQIINFFKLNFSKIEKTCIMLELGKVQNINPYVISACLKFLRQDILLDTNLTFLESVKSALNETIPILSFSLYLSRPYRASDDEIKEETIKRLRECNLEEFIIMNSNIAHLLYPVYMDEINEKFKSLVSSHNGILNALRGLYLQDKSFMKNIFMNYFTEYKKELLIKSILAYTDIKREIKLSTEETIKHFF